MIIVWLLCSQENRIYCLWFFKEAAWGGLKTWASIPPLSQEKFVINERRWLAGADNTMTRARAWHDIRAPEQHWLLTIRNTFPILRDYWLCAINIAAHIPHLVTLLLSSSRDLSKYPWWLTSRGAGLRSGSESPSSSWAWPARISSSATTRVSSFTMSLVIILTFSLVSQRFKSLDITTAMSRSGLM